MTESGVVITDWKRLWTLISGINRETPEKTVLEELQNVSKELENGLLQFEPISASKTQLETLLKEKKQEKLLPFTQRLQELLNLESKQCWEILCYYLTNEYRGSASSLAVLIATESNMSTLLDDIWGYYTLERMIVLKIVKNLLVFYKVSNHPYHHEYKEIVEKITLQKLRDSYLKQLEHLVNENPPSKLTAGEFFNYKTKLITWSERNAREINEVLHILLLICEHLPMEIDQIKKIFNCVKQHSFGKQQRFLNNSNDSLHTELLENLAYSELALLMKCLDLPSGNEEFSSSEKLAKEIIVALEKDILRMYHSPENGPLLLSWVIFNLRFTNVAQEEDKFISLRQFGKRALDLNCFSFMEKLVSNNMFNDESPLSRIVRRTIYNLLSCLCDFFDGDGSCARHAGIYELLCELLSSPTLAKEFSKQEDGGVTSLYNTLLEVFPLDFEHISLLANALTKAGMGNYIKKQLESLPILTDLYDDSKYKLRSVSGDEYILTHAVSPYAHVDFTIPAETSVVMMHRSVGLCAHFRTTVNYFNVLHNEINCLLAETIHLHGDFSNSIRIRRVEAGLCYLETLIKQTKTLSGISEEMVHPTEMCVDLLNKFKVVQYPPISLLAKCLNVCSSLLHLADSEIFTRVIHLNMLPSLINDTIDDYKKYALGISFDCNLVGSYLVDVEKKSERYDFLLAYLNFLRTYTKLQRHNYFQVEIPGLIYLLRDVFPHLHGWRFQTLEDKHKIYAEIMGFICDILDSVTNIKNDNKKIADSKKLVRDICAFSLLSMENGLILLRFVALGNAFLQHTMEMESNWMQQQSHGYILLVRLAMRILMQILRLKHHVFDGTTLSPLEALIYTQPKQRDTLRIIPVVTSYMNNIFDRWLPLLSCRLLRRIALEFNMSLLACLDMEPDQIRLTFLQKLPDELESDSLKIAILELVEACVEKQPGMTEAFFKVDMGKEKKLFGNKEMSTPIAVSILTYLEDYLAAVGKDPLTVEQALPGKVMNLLHHLWKENMQVLVAELREKPNFWENLCSPLFSELRTNVRAYTQLFNILAIEVFCCQHKGNTELKSVITKFFEEKNFKKWLDNLLDLPKVPVIITDKEDIFDEEMPEWLCRLQAFKSFLTILLKKQPIIIEIPTKQLKLLAERCLTVLIDRVRYVDDLRPFIMLLELYLYVLLSFKHTYTESAEEDQVMLHQLIEMLSQIVPCYADMHGRAREACLSITIKCTELLAEELVKDSNIALNFLNSVVNIICIELENLETSVRLGCEDSESLQNITNSSKNSTILSLNLLKTVANVFHNNGPSNWDTPFIINRMFQRLLSCASGLLSSSSKHQLSVELLDALIVLGRGNCSIEFLHCDVGVYLFLKLVPPKELLQSQNYGPAPLHSTSSNEWTIEKWWPIYARGIELMFTIFQRHERYFLKETLQFIGIHQEYLMDSLLLSKQTLQPAAISLIKNAVTLISYAVKFEKEWRLEHPQSLFNLLRAVQILMGHCISMFNQPKNLRSLVAGRRSKLEIIRDIENAGWVDEVITTLNDLTEIIILCAKTLQYFSPKLIDLICEPQIMFTQWEPIFEMNFGAPKMDESSVQLSFGTVLSVIGVLTKALNLQNFGFNEVPLNILPIGADTDTVDQINAAKKSSAYQRNFSKSLSVASTSSISCPPNELLSNLDSELCILALEHVLMLVASQSLLALRNPYLPLREKQLVRREISTELLTYHEFVRKKVLIDHRDYKDLWHRRKHGLVLMHNLKCDESTSIYGNDLPDQVLGTPHTRTSLDIIHRPISADLRVTVIRRLHLQNRRKKSQSGGAAFEISHPMSPIVTEDKSSSGASSSSSTAQNPIAASSTPLTARPPMRRPNAESLPLEEEYKKRAYAETSAIDDDEDIIFFPPEEPKYSPISYVHKDYSDRHLKDEQNTILISKYPERYPKATQDDVNRKINILRSNFKRELRRLQNSKKKSNLWYSEAIGFIKDLTPLEIMSRNFNHDKIMSRSIPQMDYMMAKDIKIDVMPQQTMYKANNFEKICEVWALKLQEMNSNQSLIAEKLINDAIFYGQMNYLNMESTIKIDSRTSSPVNAASWGFDCNPAVIGNAMDSMKSIDSTSSDIKPKFLYDSMPQLEGPHSTSRV